MEYLMALCCEPMRSKRILIVEDDADVRRLFRTALAMAGYDVEEAGDGVDALRLIENRAPDLIVLDLVLRSLDGISVQQELAAQSFTRHIPIVIVTGSDAEVKPPFDAIAVNARSGAGILLLCPSGAAHTFRARAWLAENSTSCPASGLPWGSPSFT